MLLIIDLRFVGLKKTFKVLEWYCSLKKEAVERTESSPMTAVVGPP